MQQVWEVAQRLPQINRFELALSATVVASVLAGHRLAPRFPVALLIVVGSIAASAAFGFAQRGIAIVGPVPGGLPSFGLPDVSWREVVALLPVAASCVVMIIAQSAATSRGFAERHGETVDTNADLLGLSAANAAAAFSGTFTVNGSPTQTAMADAAGGRSQLAQITFAGVTLLVLLFLTGPLQYLPRCVLASLVFTIAVRMVDLRGLAAIRRESPGEHALALLTALAVLVLGVEQGILMAVVLSLLRHVRHSYLPHTSVLRPDPLGGWDPAPSRPGVETWPGVVLYRFGADLFYANEKRFCDEVRALVGGAPTPVRWFVVDASAITDIDYSAARSLRDLIDELARRKVALVFARVTADLRADMDRHGITAALGSRHLYRTLHEALAEVRAAGGPLADSTRVS